MSTRITEDAQLHSDAVPLRSFLTTLLSGRSSLLCWFTSGLLTRGSRSSMLRVSILYNGGAPLYVKER
jgi:hypothetical protein